MSPGPFVIYKYRLDVGQIDPIMLPRDAEVLRVAQQSGEITMWVKLSLYAEKVARNFRVLGTGMQFSVPDGQDARYCGTAFVGVYVWHVFEIVSEISGPARPS